MIEEIRVIDDIRGIDLGDCAQEFLASLGGPAWFRVPGHDRSRTRAIVTLLHGNEPSGVRAVREWLRAGAVPAVDAVFHIASVDAALAAPLFSTRALPGRRDANRCFFPPFEGREGRRAAELLELLRRASPEALVDLHNNTGESPAYGVGLVADSRHLGLTALFANRYMLSNLHMGTLMEATHPDVPGVVIECGKAGDAVADAVALAGLERYLTLDALTSAPTGHLEILTDPIRVFVRPAISLVIDDLPRPGVGLTIRSGIDRHNFDLLPAGTVVGWVEPESEWPFEARGADDADASHSLFENVDGVIITRKSFVPIMMTNSAEIAKSDCLFYVMQRHGASPSYGE